MSFGFVNGQPFLSPANNTIGGERHERGAIVAGFEGRVVDGPEGYGYAITHEKAVGVLPIFMFPELDEYYDVPPVVILCFRRTPVSCTVALPMMRTRPHIEYAGFDGTSADLLVLSIADAANLGSFGMCPRVRQVQIEELKMYVPYAPDDERGPGPTPVVAQDDGCFDSAGEFARLDDVTQRSFVDWRISAEWQPIESHLNTMYDSPPTGRTAEFVRFLRGKLEASAPAPFEDTP
jgi:hypothetical protein